MARLKRLKRRVLRQAIEENLLLLRGGYPRRRRRRGATRMGLFALVPAALVASAFALAASRWPMLPPDNSQDPLPAAPEAMLTSSLLRDEVEVESQPIETSSLRFAAPRAIDRRVFPLGVRKIILDPGHGGPSGGTVTSSGLKEKALALDIALLLRERLRSSGYEVVMTREEDREVSLEERVTQANQASGDLFVSIHLNWIATRSVRGVETYYLGPTDDPYLTALAGTENQDSGYSLTDFRRLLEGIYVDVRQDESRELAEAVQSSLHRSLKRVNPKLQNRGVKSAPFVVLIGTNMPAILAEVSCLSNQDEAELLTRPRYRGFIADALAEGIQSYADSRRQIAEKGTRP